MEQIKVIIEKADTNYAAYIDGINGIAVTGKTLLEIKEKFQDVIDFHIEGCREFGIEIPKQLQGEYELEFVMDTITLLNYYDGIIGKPALEKITGINQKQLWHYASGKAKPRQSQREKINKGLHQLGSELLMVSI
ncbi:MAG: type II toxin-antitoxin system HicB family antitoxin [Bacteroidaceae bacterium]|nr:type II toxin-antitoxin system HicB family antitoxin [Bacteroidaceae bacterium]